MPFPGYFSQRKTRDVAARADGPVVRRLNRRRPDLEGLERRNLLSFIGSEHRISFNPQATANTSSDNASCNFSKTPGRMAWQLVEFGHDRTVARHL